MTERPSLDPGRMKPPFSDELRRFLARGWGERAPLGPGDAAAATAAARRRERLSERFPGERLVLPAGRLVTRANDTDYAFRAASDYAWATADQTCEAVLVMEPVPGGHAGVLYLREATDRSDPDDAFNGAYGEFYVGRRRSLAENAEALGLETRSIQTLPGDLDGRSARVVRGEDPLVDSLVPVEDPYLDAELRAVLSELRLVKDAWEVDQLQDAVDATIRGFEDMVGELDRAVATSERWLEGTFFRRARTDGNDIGYGSIVASGPRATALHWIRNDGPVTPGDLLLIDAGVENRYLYTADVTRTLPIGGRFTTAQREVYDLVARAQRASLALARPGVTVRAFNEEAVRVMAEGLADWGILPMSAEESLREENGLHRRYTRHGIGHMLGLDVHDCSHARSAEYLDGVLQPGHVITCEPGLYFDQDDLTVPAELRGLGIRIEDDLVITTDGHRLLTEALPREAVEVEAWMAGIRGRGAGG